MWHHGALALGQLAPGILSAEVTHPNALHPLDVPWKGANLHRGEGMLSCILPPPPPPFIYPHGVYKAVDAAVEEPHQQRSCAPELHAPRHAAVEKCGPGPLPPGPLWVTAPV